MSSYRVGWVGVICGLLVAVNVNPATADGPGPFLLRYKFAENQSLRYEVDHAQTMFSQYASTERTDTNRVHERKQLQVLNVDAAGAADLQTVFEHVRMEAQFGDADAVVFDSDQPPADDPRQFSSIRSAIDQPQTKIRIDARGTLLAVDGKPDAAINTRQNFMIVFPEAPVPLQGSWTDLFSVEVTVNKEIKRNVELIRTYRLQSVQGGIAHISVSTSVKSPIRDPQLLAQLIQSKPTGTIRFDMNEGRILERTAKLDESVINAFGNGSLMRANSLRTESFIDVRQIAARP